MSAYIGTGGARSVSSMYVGIDGKARQVQKAYIGVNGVAKLWYQRGTPLGSLAVGSTVKIAVGGKDYDWLVVHQGIPDASIYDSSCDGTWLLMEDVYDTSIFDSDNNSYKDSSIRGYLNSTFFNLIDADIRNAIKQVKIPYQNGTGSGGSLATGSNGLSTKVFLLSGYEVGWTTSNSSYFPKDGVRLAYFLDGSGTNANNKRIAYNGSSAATWWLRSPSAGSKINAWCVDSDGSNTTRYRGVSLGVRPCMILPKDALVDDTGHIRTPLGLFSVEHH